MTRTTIVCLHGVYVPRSRTRTLLGGLQQGAACLATMFGAGVSHAGVPTSDDTCPDCSASSLQPVPSASG